VAALSEDEAPLKKSKLGRTSSAIIGDVEPSDPEYFDASAM
jgi:hypothetical protein